MEALLELLTVHESDAEQELEVPGLE